MIDQHDSRADLDGSESFELHPEPQHRNLRLDRYIAEVVSDLSRSQAQSLIDDGLVMVDGVHRKASFKVTPGEQVSVEVPPVAGELVEPEDLPIEVIHEDDDVIVINKAAGMVVHPAPGHTSGTLVNALRFHFQEIDARGTERTGIVHRLDKDTSGVMIVAKHNAAMRTLQEQWMQGAVEKRYLALVGGVVQEDEAVIDVPVARHRLDRKKMGVDRDGRSALTIIDVRDRFKNATLLDVDLRTGRTHQIRVHLAYIKHPILGDTVYGTSGSREESARLGIRRQMLHAAALQLALPSDGVPRTFEASPPADMHEVVTALRDGQVDHG